jgi:arylsulfatase A-like enzyme
MATLICTLAAAGALRPARVLAADSPHNVIIFVADGLRHHAVDTGAMPTFADLRANGVNFTNSHSLFPTVTTPNASAIATGHYLGDTGNFSNTLFLNYPALGHDVESNVNIADFNAHFEGNYLGEVSLIAAARDAGMHTAILGKHGPALVQEVTRNNRDVTAENVGTIIIDDATGAAAGRTRNGVPLPAAFSRRLANDPYFKTTYFKETVPENDPRSPARTANAASATKVANTEQQKYFIDCLTRAVLPSFVEAADKKPFVVVYWSRDPDGTQHAEVDVPDQLQPGINGPTVKLAFQNADNNLKQLLEYLRTTPDPNDPAKKLADTTDIFITSDHGFSTASRGILNTDNAHIDTFATQQRYSDTREGQVPSGIIAIDLAHDLDLPLFDDDKPTTANGVTQYRKLKLEGTAGAGNWAEHPSGTCLIGGKGTYSAADGFDTQLIASGTNFYIPLPRAGAAEDKAFVAKAVAALSTKPYLSGVFVDTDRFGEIPGALSLKDINLKGAARTPTPAIVTSWKSFSVDPANPTMTGIILNDGYRTGGGTHGSFGRQDTYNCMIAFGPDFKSKLEDPDPVSNADIANTLGHIIGIDLHAKARGKLTGRVIDEALANGPAPRGSKSLTATSTPTPAGIATILNYQLYTDPAGAQYRYFDTAGFPGQTNMLGK